MFPQAPDLSSLSFLAILAVSDMNSTMYWGFNPIGKWWVTPITSVLLLPQHILQVYHCCRFQIYSWVILIITFLLQQPLFFTDHKKITIKKLSYIIYTIPSISFGKHRSSATSNYFIEIWAYDADSHDSLSYLSTQDVIANKTFQIN